MDDTGRSHELTRRTALGVMAVGVGALSASRVGASTTGGVLTPEQLGWDEASGRYVLPDLPYPHDALEPFIDEQTMRIHHGKHHAGYVRKLNGALQAMAELRDGRGDPGLSDHWARELSFNGGGHVNHTLFWTGMAPAGDGGGGRPSGALAEGIDRDFGSYAKFEAQFRSVAGAVKGSGWGWLAYEPIAGRLLVAHMHNQEHSLFAGLVPLLGVDVWEHAYYLRYQNQRAAYLDAFMNVVNWAEIGRRLDAALAG